MDCRVESSKRDVIRPSILLRVFPFTDLKFVHVPLASSSFRRFNADLYVLKENTILSEMFNVFPHRTKLKLDVSSAQEVGGFSI
jgi:hypothetical protein